MKTTRSGENDLGDTLRKKNTSLTDQYFEEIAAMLEQSDESTAHLEAIAIKNREADDKNTLDFFDEILCDIPESERPDIPANTKTEEEMMAEVDLLVIELKKLADRSREDARITELRKKHELEIADPDYITYHMIQRRGLNQRDTFDQKRIVRKLMTITDLILQLPVWSSAKNEYNKILLNKNLSQYDKVQMLVASANEVIAKNAKTKRGFLMTRLNMNADAIHKAIADIDINLDEPVHITGTTHFLK